MTHTLVLLPRIATNVDVKVSVVSESPVTMDDTNRLPGLGDRLGI